MVFGDFSGHWYKQWTLQPSRFNPLPLNFAHFHQYFDYSRKKSISSSVSSYHHISESHQFHHWFINEGTDFHWAHISEHSTRWFQSVPFNPVQPICYNQRPISPEFSISPRSRKRHRAAKAENRSPRHIIECARVAAIAWCTRESEKELRWLLCSGPRPESSHPQSELNYNKRLYPL